MHVTRTQDLGLSLNFSVLSFREHDHNIFISNKLEHRRWLWENATSPRRGRRCAHGWTPGRRRRKNRWFAIEVNVSRSANHIIPSFHAVRGCPYKLKELPILFLPQRTRNLCWRWWSYRICCWYYRKGEQTRNCSAVSGKARPLRVYLLRKTGLDRTEWTSMRRVIPPHATLVFPPQLLNHQSNFNASPCNFRAALLCWNI